MPNGTTNSTTTIGDLTITSSVVRPADAILTYDPVLPAGTAGVSENKTDADTGDVDLEAGHGLSNDDTVDVYWDDGRRYGMDAQVATNIITLDGGAGDDLPADGTAMVVTKQVQITAGFDGDEVQMIVVGCDQRCHLDFQDSGSNSLAAVDIPAGEKWQWAVDTGIANPLTGNATADIFASNASSTVDALLKIGIMIDSTPES